MMRPVWRIDLLGALQAKRIDQEAEPELGTVNRFRTRRVAALLARLAFAPRRIHPRDELATLLWPDEDIEVARRNLRQALFSLRQSLEVTAELKGKLIKTVHDSIQLAPELIETDVGLFQTKARALEQAPNFVEAAREAIELYQGELLPGFYEEWIPFERIRLDEIYLQILRALSKRLITEGRPESLNYIRLALGKEPLEEEWNLELMKFYLSTSEPEKAVRHFEEYRDRLGAEIGRPPTDEIVAVYGEALKAQGLSRSRTPSNVPKPRNLFVGREREIGDLTRLVGTEQGRFLSLVGIPGVGKTRLALEFANRSLETDRTPIWFVPLANCVDRSCFLDTFSSSLAPLKVQVGESIDACVRAIPGGSAILILDSIEQVADEVSELVDVASRERPDVRMLITSRRPLHLDGETVVSVDPLTSGESAILFAERRPAHGKDLLSGDEQNKPIEDLCARVEGIPLAIEILAGLTSALSPHQILHHFPLSLSTVESKRRDVPERHRSLRAAIDYSVASLSSELQDLFTYLSVFHGSFSVNAAADILAAMREGGGADHRSVLQDLLTLNDLSLLNSSQDEGGEVRFRMLNIFRDYSTERLNPTQLDRLRLAHAEFFLRQSPKEDVHRTASSVASDYPDLERDYNDSVAAIETFYVQGKPVECLRILDGLSIGWKTRGPKAFEREFIKRLAYSGLSDALEPHLQVRLLRMLGTTYIRSSDYQAAYEALEKSVEIATKTGDTELLATSRSGLSVCAGYLGRMDECLSLNLSVLELASEDNYRLRERSYLGIGSVLLDRGDLVGARDALQSALECSRKQPNGEPDLLILVNLGRVALDMGQFDQAYRIIAEASRLARKRGDDFGLAIALTVESRIHWKAGRLREALETNRQALEKSQEGDFSFWIVHCIRYAGLVLSDTGDYSEAATLLSASEEFRNSAGSADETDHQRCIGVIKSNLGGLAFETAWSKGAALDQREAARLAAFVSSLVSTRLHGPTVDAVLTTGS